MVRMLGYKSLTKSLRGRFVFELEDMVHTGAEWRVSALGIGELIRNSFHSLTLVGVQHDLSIPEQILCFTAAEPVFPSEADYVDTKAAVG